MSDELNGTGAVEGQAAPGNASEGATTQAAPSSGEGKPAGTDQTTASSGTGQVEDSFFDPKDLDPALVPAYKQMQRAFGKKMEQIKADRAKIDAYDAFSKDPLTQLQTMAAQMGFRLSRADAAAMANQDQGPWEPQNWDEVMARAEERIMQKLSPVFTELQNVKKTSIEKMLDESCPDWRQYEDEMTSLLHEHPTLAKDPVKLYALAVPREVLETRATQAALKKLQAKADGAKVQGTSTTKQQAANLPDKMSFNDAVAYAKARLAEQGLKPPH